MDVGPFDIRLRAKADPLTISDYRALARRRLPPMVWSYVENGADRGRTLAANESAFAEWEPRQRVLAGLQDVDLTTSVAGVELDLPILLAPLGLSGLLHWRGEVASARGAEVAGTRLVLSTGSSYSMEEVAEATAHPHFFQLYPWGDRALTGSLVDRARAAGYAALFVTVDVPVVGNRLGERRRGMGIPPVLTPGRMAQAAARPRWAYRFLRHRRVSLQNLATPETRGSVLMTAQRQAVNMRPDLSWRDLAWLRDRWEGPLYIKGILDPADAESAVATGVDGIVVSNHGGRQLDGAAASLWALTDIVGTVAGRAKVLLDGGIRSGSDVAVAMALGADAVLVGRPQAYGLAASGGQGVVSVLRILEEELRRTLHLMGAPSVKELGPSNVRAKGAPRLTGDHTGIEAGDEHRSTA